MKKYSGKLISIEGIEGCGKSTLAKNLSSALKKAGRQVLLTREPGDTCIGPQIRQILCDPKFKICAKTEFLLFAADRAEHFQEKIIPALDEGVFVISDRMGDSSVAYQGYGRELDVEIIKNINTWAMNSITPDLVVYLRLDVHTAISRVANRGESLSTFEQEKKDFWQRVIDGYEKIFTNRPEVLVLDATASEVELVEKVLEKLF